MSEFIECDSCRAKPGSPILCGSCLERRDVWYANEKREAMERLKGMSSVPMKEYWTIKAVENGRSIGCLANDGNYFANSDNHPPARFSSMVPAAAEVMRWREMRHRGTGTGPKYKLVHHTVKTKPRGAKVGTWAWACEQMLAGKEVRMAGSGRKYAIANGLIASHLDPYGWHTLPGVFTRMLRGTEWQVVAPIAYVGQMDRRDA